MFHLKRTICALLVFAALASASAAQARNYYVATTGSDSNPGTLAQPFRTIVKGVSVLKPGETTFVRAGTYAESINTNQIQLPKRHVLDKCGNPRCLSWGKCDHTR